MHDEHFNRLRKISHWWSAQRWICSERNVLLVVNQTKEKDFKEENKIKERAESQKNERKYHEHKNNLWVIKRSDHQVSGQTVLFPRFPIRLLI